MTLERLKRKWRLLISDRALRRRTKRKLWSWTRGLTLLVLSAALIYLSNRYIAPQHLPWRKLDVDAPMGLSTKLQLTRVSFSPSSICMAMAQQAANMKSIPADPLNGDGPCGWDVARLMYSAGDVALAPGEATLQCPLALGQYIWLREVDVLAQRHLNSGVAKLHHAGSYSCRRQRGNGSGAWSEHAFANALDVTGFTLDDGRVISVLKDWDGKTAPDKSDRRAFLRAVRDKGCKIFRVTLSPDFNAAHKDHFHFDMGPSTSCR